MAESVQVVNTVNDNYSDLDGLVEEFERWQKDTVELNRDNKTMCLQLKNIEKKCELFSQSEKHLMDNNAKLNCIIKDLHKILDKRCDYEEENSQLKEQVTKLHKEIRNMEEQHEQRMMEASENINTLRESHYKEISKAQETIKQQKRKEVQSLQSIINGKDGDIKQLQQSLSDIEKVKHTEIVKLRLEYDAKLLKLQKQNIKSQTSHHQSSANSDIYRRKLQAVHGEYEKEVTALKRKIAELEKQLSLGHKRRKL